MYSIVECYPAGSTNLAPSPLGWFLDPKVAARSLNRLPPQHPEFATNLEAEALIEGHSRLVLGAHMEEGRLATVPCALCQGECQATSQPSATRLRMRCNCAKLDIARKPHALAGH